jgi:hypothetical protein
MKNRKVVKLKLWIFASAVSGILLLLIAEGCSRVTVKVTQTVQTGGSMSAGAGAAVPHPAGGAFVPGQAGVLSSSGQLLTGGMCGLAVTTNKVVFQFTINGQTLPYQTPPTGTKGFWGQIVDLNNLDANNNPIPIPSGHYVLYLYAAFNKKGCCTNVFSPPGPANTVGTNVFWTNSTSFTAYFLQNLEPPPGHQLQLLPPPGYTDAWTQ